MNSSPIIIAFGAKARQGKGECAQFLYERYSQTHNILLTSFAAALRNELRAEVENLMEELDLYSPQAALHVLCGVYGVPFDAYAKPEPLYPYGKQRALLQAYGMSKRAIDQNHWVKKVSEQIARVQPDIVIIDDLRFQSEHDWVVGRGGVAVEVSRPGANLKGAVGQHISEHDLEGQRFQYQILNDGTLAQLHARADAIFRAVVS